MFLSSNDSTETKISLKLFIDKRSNKVLFAEARKEFVDFLFYLLSLPVGTFIRLLKSGNMVGSIGNVYQSLENLNEAYVQPNQHTNFLLKPDMPYVVTSVPPLLPDTSQDPAQRKFYKCANNHRYATDILNAICPSCKSSMSSEVTFVGRNSDMAGSTTEGGVEKGLATYMVMDDLTITPMSMISGVAMLNKGNVKDFSALEERMV
ncbi:LOW QUALITY PROTEIN: uncharacterized protein LOC110425541 [Herrania umbratica]|uniref:LOW QUALITY PROTEIN: uncharacterized protein LOC110425541 n=1 Tax=Herrania umbratica TaxID=108875 RepID=A0A6J1BAD0_9ROSI|nr:LOW QUALITY PROTEIN: uncharacterized protein LOC110425541 [Herrania umbratica]